LAYRPKKRYLQSYEFLGDLENCATGKVMLFAPQEIKNEVSEHHNYHTYRGSPEISHRTLEKVSRCASEMQDLINYQIPKGIDKRLNQSQSEDALRYILRGIHHQNFSGKKLIDDPISANDWQVIDWAARLGSYSRCLFDDNRLEANPLLGTFKIAVLASDSHIYRTIDKAFDDPEAVGLSDYVRTINPRRYSF
jgi:hypothetical protein